MSRDSTLPSFFGRATIAFDGHTELKDAARALGDHCRTESGSEPASAGASIPSLEAFAEQVLAHFLLEEGGSYFGAVAHDSPELADQIAHLKGEHGAMREQLKRLLAVAGTSPRSSEFRAELARFVERFEAHEKHESALLQRFFLEEASAAG